MSTKKPQEKDTGAALELDAAFVKDLEPNVRTAARAAGGRSSGGGVVSGSGPAGSIVT